MCAPAGRLLTDGDASAGARRTRDSAAARGSRVPSAGCAQGPSYFLIPVLGSASPACGSDAGNATSVLRSHHCDPIRYAAPAIYRANRPQRVHFSVTWDFGGGGMRVGSRSIGPEQDGQLSGEPLRSLAIRCSACAGLYVFGRGLRMNASKESVRARPDDPAHRLSLKSNRSWRGPSARPVPRANGRARPGWRRTRRADLYTASCGKRSGGRVGASAAASGGAGAVQVAASSGAVRERPLLPSTTGIQWGASMAVSVWFPNWPGASAG